MLSQIPPVVYGGIFTFILLLITAAIPYLGQKGIIKNHYKIHMWLARTVIVLVLLHGIYAIIIFL